MSKLGDADVRNRIEKMFASFGMDITVGDANVGPTVTLYELHLAPGIRLSKVNRLTDNLAMTLGVQSVRLIYPLVDRKCIGLEVPNDKREFVMLMDLHESLPDTGYALPLYIGKDTGGNAITADLAKLPHLLIAGRTGTGKSVCINTIISSMLLTKSPEQVEFIMIDPKMVEMTQYRNIPHLACPIVTDMTQAKDTLQNAVDVMENRYAALSRHGVRHIDEYNKLEGDGPNVPYTVIIIDEMADLMMAHKKDVESSIVRLAQKGRAAGVHLIVATQRPTADVITGLIKANLPARIAFQVSAKLDSRVVLDTGGAEALLGNGDLLFLNPRDGLLARGQGAFISDGDLQDKVIDKWAQDDNVVVVTPPPPTVEPERPFSIYDHRDMVEFIIHLLLTAYCITMLPWMTPIYVGIVMFRYVWRHLRR